MSAKLDWLCICFKFFCKSNRLMIVEGIRSFACNSGRSWNHTMERKTCISFLLLSKRPYSLDRAAWLDSEFWQLLELWKEWTVLLCVSGLFLCAAFFVFLPPSFWLLFLSFSLFQANSLHAVVVWCTNCFLDLLSLFFPPFPSFSAFFNSSIFMLANEDPLSKVCCDQCIICFISPLCFFFFVPPSSSSSIFFFSVLFFFLFFLSVSFSLRSPT